MKTKRITQYAVKRNDKFMTTQFAHGLFVAETAREGLLFIHKHVAQHAAARLHAEVVPVQVSKRI